jgi:hypothetical protein
MTAFTAKARPPLGNQGATAGGTSLGASGGCIHRTWRQVPSRPYCAGRLGERAPHAMKDTAPLCRS